MGSPDYDSTVHCLTQYDPHACKPSERNFKKGQQTDQSLIWSLSVNKTQFWGLIEWFRNKIIPSKENYSQKMEICNLPIEVWKKLECLRFYWELILTTRGWECWQYKNNHLLQNRRGRSQVGHIPHKGNVSSLLASYALEGNREAGSREVEERKYERVSYLSSMWRRQDRTGEIVRQED